jgi:hypothetical protein
MHSKAICHFLQNFLCLCLGVEIMTQQKILNALERIETALAIIETKGVAGQSSMGDPALLHRHEQLKAETRLAIAEIDQILSKLES